MALLTDDDGGRDGEEVCGEGEPVEVVAGEEGDAHGEEEEADDLGRNSIEISIKSVL